MTFDALTRRTPLSDEELERLGRLTAIQPRRDYLDAIDSERRALTLRLESDRLLRMPDNSKQVRAVERLRAELREQIRAQMMSRRPFRGPVSVEIDLHATAVAQPPASPPSVKAYLDLLGKQGSQAVAYRDDAQVCHLRVRRHARDHPIHRAEPEDWLHMDGPRFPSGPKRGVEVRILVRPLRLYTADYDRLFRRREAVFGEDAPRSGGRYDRDRYDAEPPGARFWARAWNDLDDDDRLRELRREEQDDASNRGSTRQAVCSTAPTR
jgi:hypothetical protein